MDDSDVFAQAVLATFLSFFSLVEVLFSVTIRFFKRAISLFSLDLSTPLKSAGFECSFG